MGQNPLAPIYGRYTTEQVGGKWTKEKSRFFDAWAQAEGTKAAYNPFATTKKGYAGETNFNSVGVKNYRDPATGRQATFDTITNGYYPNIVNLLKRDDVTAEQLANAVAASPWGTGAGVLRVLGVTDASAYEEAANVMDKGKTLLTGQREIADPTFKRLSALMPTEGYMNAMTKLGPLADRMAQHQQQQQENAVAMAQQLRPSTPVEQPAMPSVDNPVTPWNDPLPGGNTSKWVVMRSGADREGMPTNPAVFDFVSSVAQVYGKPLTIGTGTAHNQFVKGTNRESEHWKGNAADIPATGKELTRMGQDALIAAGMPEAQARKKTGGVFNVNGYQILFNTNTGGNHFNHLHVGVGRAKKRET